jgi:hypothetical protein
LLVFIVEDVPKIADTGIVEYNVSEPKDSLIDNKQINVIAKDSNDITLNVLQR